MSEVDLKAAAEAILMVAPSGVTAQQLGAALGLDSEQTASLINEIRRDYADHGFALREVGGAWRIYSRPEYDEYVQRFIQGEREASLSQAALETLAVIAYRQPVARAAVAAIRGVNVDGVCRTLEAHGLIERSGVSDSGATLWVTSEEFLTVFGLNSLDDLPPLAPHVPDMEQLEDVIERLEAGSGGSTPSRG